MKAIKRLGAVVFLLGALVACSPGGSKLDSNLFSETNAWKEGIPADAQMVSPDEFQKGIASGELVLSSTATVAATKQAREKQYQNDKTTLNNISNKDPNIKALLDEAATTPNFEGDRPVSGPGGQEVVLFGLGTQLRNANESYKLSQSVDNALDDYTLSYALLPDDLKPQAPTPDSLKGKSLVEVRAALELLNNLLGSRPLSLKTARLESGGGIQPQAINPGNGSDQDANCAAPTGLVARYWFPLKNFISPIKNQAKRGTCWAFTAIGAVESRERVQNNNPANLSEQFLINKVKQDWDSDDYSDGYWSEKALGTAVDRGQSIPSEGGWTYNPAWGRPTVKDGDSNSYANSCNSYSGTCSDTAHQSRRVCTTFIFTFCSYAKVTFGGPGVAASKTIQVWKNGDSFDLNRLRNYLSQGYVLLASFPVYKGFMDDVKSDGIVSNYARTKLENGKEVSGSYGGHAVQIVGFLSNEDMTQFGQTPNVGGGGYFIVKNSWGCGAGDGGFYYVPADYVSSIFNSLSVLNFDGRRSDAWKQEQAAPGGSEAPKITIKTNPASVNLRVETNLAQFFAVTHPVAKSVNLTVTSNTDGILYSGSWSTDRNSLFGPELKRTFTSAGSRTLTLLTKYGSSQASSSFVVNVTNTPPTLNLQYGGDPHQGEAYPITALITDPNEPDTTRLCGSTQWSVDAPDTLSGTAGCSVSVTFGTTGARQIRVTTQDSEGATASRTLTLDVLPPPVNPYPKITDYGVYSREFTGGQIRFCGSVKVAGGSTIVLSDIGCTFRIGPAPTRYYGGITVENPDNEALTYDWKLYVSGPGFDKLLLANTASTSNVFDLYNVNNAGLGTDNCRVTVKVNAPDPSRSKGPITIWTGRCTYYSFRLN
ncbi:C1 family peptidase [Meiothermus sp.]|uniref:C1 family peptidase n=1 Tax=Meiothermus sp. TaxID=1955249 RepID=UPI00307D39C3